MSRTVLCTWMVLAAMVWGVHAGSLAGETEAKVTKDQLAGEWIHSPGIRKAFLLRADGSGILRSYLTGNVQCTWDFNEHYQGLVLVSRQLKRQYRAKIEDGKVVLCEGRDVWFKGTNMNAPLASPLDKAVKAEE